MRNCELRLYVGLDLVAMVVTVRQAWDILAMIPAGSPFELRNAHGRCLRAGYV